METSTETSTVSLGDHSPECWVTIPASRAWQVKDWCTETEAEAAIHIHRKLREVISKASLERKVTKACKSSLSEATKSKIKRRELRSPWKMSHCGVFQMLEMKLWYLSSVLQAVTLFWSDYSLLLIWTCSVILYCKFANFKNIFTWAWYEFSIKIS